MRLFAHLFRLDHNLFLVGSVVDEVALGQVTSEYFGFPHRYHCTNIPYEFINSFIHLFICSFFRVFILSFINVFSHVSTYDTIQS